MKIKTEIEITPEEVRELWGLPSVEVTQGYWENNAEKVVAMYPNSLLDFTTQMQKNFFNSATKIDK